MPMIRTAFIERCHVSPKNPFDFGKLSRKECAKTQISEISFGGDLREMALILVGTGGFEPPTSTVSR